MMGRQKEKGKNFSVDLNDSINSKSFSIIWFSFAKNMVIQKSKEGTEIHDQ